MYCRIPTCGAFKLCIMLGFLQGYFSLPQGYPYQWGDYVYYPVPYIPPQLPVYSYPVSCCCVGYETETDFSENADQEITEDGDTIPEKTTQMASTTGHPTTTPTTISQLTKEQTQQSNTESTVTLTESKTESSKLMTETTAESTIKMTESTQGSTTEPTTNESVSPTETAKQTPETTDGSTTKSSESTAESTDISTKKATESTTQTTEKVTSRSSTKGFSEYTGNEVSQTEDYTFPTITAA
jgi:Predicted solute binding protein